MKIVLSESLFTNDEYTVDYADRQATFTLIDETVVGASGSVEINRVVCTVRTYATDGSVEADHIGSLVVGIGDAYVGVTSDDTTLLGKIMTASTMSSCTVELYES